MDNTLPEYVSTADAAASLGYTLQHTRLLIRMGKLRARKFGRDWLIERAAVDELLQTRATPDENS